MNDFSPLESFREKTFMQDVERLGGQALKQNPAWYAGIPDRLCWLPRSDGNLVWFWAEWKRGNEDLKPHQRIYHDKLRKKGHLVYVFRDNNEARTVMRGLMGAV